MATYTLRYATNLAADPLAHPIPAQLAQGDSDAYVFEAQVFDSRDPQETVLAGTVTGSVIRPDGGTVTFLGEKDETTTEIVTPQGTFDATVCRITLPQAALAYPGRVNITIRLIDGAEETTVLNVSAVVVRTDTGTAIDPGEVVPNLAELLAMIGDCEDATEAAQEAADHAVQYDASQSLTSAQKTQARTNIGVEDALLNRGNLVSLGYTTPGSVSTPGIYTFTSGNLASLTGMPAGWFGGGVLIVYKGGDVIWQNLRSAQFNFFRYGTSATWTSGFTSTAGARENSRTTLGASSAPGTYTFTTGESAGLTDLPSKWPSSGGFLRTYAANGTTYQMVDSLTGSYIRYGTSAAWRDLRPSLWVQYTSGDDGTGSSVVQYIDVYIPRDTGGGFIMWRLAHCRDNDINCNTWRINHVYAEDNGGTLTRLSEKGEWECAVMLSGRPDFSGGLLHGDEQQQAIQAYVDGVPTSISSLKTKCNTFRFTRVSNLYDPNDHTTVIAVHGVEYLFTRDGLTVSQSVDWKVSGTLGNCYLAMLPASKSKFSTYYLDTSIVPTTLPTTQSYELNFPGVHRITEFGSAAYITMERLVYPTGMTGETALIGDNNTSSYHKGYFRVCSGGSVTSDTVWRSTVTYKLT